MFKPGLSQSLKLGQKLSPQQIQFIKLLQVPTTDMERRIKEELEMNDALEEAEENATPREEFVAYEEGKAEQPEAEANDIDRNDLGDEQLSEYIGPDDSYDNTGKLPYSSDEEDRYEVPIVQMSTLFDALESQIGMLDISAHELALCHHLIGSLDDSGYLTRPLEAIQDDLAFRSSIEAEIPELEHALSIVQRLEPAGVGARNLQECLELQLHRKEASPANTLAIKLISKYFDEFTRKHYDKLIAKLNITESELRDAIQIISRLNPKPGESQTADKVSYVVPDFLLIVENQEIDIKLNIRNAPELRVNKAYREMLRTYVDKQKRNNASQEVKETIQYMKTRIDNAQSFIDAIRQRQLTLLRTMMCIAERQKGFFLSEGDAKQLKPMILKDVADEVGMDISTISRVSNSKYVQTDFGIFPLKYFFSEGITTDSGEEVSTREVKKTLSEFIENEDKRKPFSDEQLAKMLNDKGYTIARRTVVKYREEMSIPVARLRKEI